MTVNNVFPLILSGPNMATKIPASNEISLAHIFSFVIDLINLCRVKINHCHHV